jgi:hypothetical protein
MFPRLEERYRQAAGTLSGGEQQMLAIGRCLMGQPELIMFDEPSLGLAPAVVQEVFRTIKRLNERGMTVILVEQNVAVSLKLASRAYVLENGRVVMAGAGAELLGDDRIRQAYPRPLAPRFADPDAAKGGMFTWGGEAVRISRGGYGLAPFPQYLTAASLISCSRAARASTLHFVGRRSIAHSACRQTGGTRRQVLSLQPEGDAAWMATDSFRADCAAHSSPMA